MIKHVHLLYGGLIGPDGFIDSAGMNGLADRLQALPGISVNRYMWDHYEGAAAAMQVQPPEDRTILIGYSGGGSRATYLSREYPRQIIDLMVLYDPSPKWQMVPLYSNVKRAVCYYNETPHMFGLGGGKVTGMLGYTGEIEILPIAEQHLMVQFDQQLHARTVWEVENLK